VEGGEIVRLVGTERERHGRIVEQNARRTSAAGF